MEKITFKTFEGAVIDKIVPMQDGTVVIAFRNKELPLIVDSKVDRSDQDSDDWTSEVVFSVMQRVEINE
jgi:hypothetical protein